MYAVFQTGGKQYLAKEGQIIRLEKIDIKVGEYVEFSEILLIANNKVINVGKPFINGVKIKAEIINHGRDKKIKIIKFRRRKHYRRKNGHRQWFTDVKISNINI